MNNKIYFKRKLPIEIYCIEILKANNVQLQSISRQMGLALNLEEMKSIRSHYNAKKRNPTDIELQILAQTWSEHCFHKTFKGIIVTSDGKKIDSLFKTYIERATRELKKPWCLSVFEDNAGIISFEGETAIAAKVETHNHPSAIEPFGGAATGTGGVIRDVLGVWANPIACTDVLGFGPLDADYYPLPLGVKHPKYIFRGVVAGIGHYGNNMGIPTVNGAIYFEDSYAGNVIVYCGCIGILPFKKYVRRAKAGHIIVLAGGRTGRDGIHGVNFASLELTEESEYTSRPAVQIANPIEEEKLRRAIISIRDQELASSITDLGGGGLSSAVGETAHRFKCGSIVELDKVHLKYPHIPPWEIYVSESQERMLMTVKNENLKKVLEIFKSENVKAENIGNLTEELKLVIKYRGFIIAELDMNFLFSPPKVQRFAEWKKPNFSESNIREPSNMNELLIRILASPNIASKEAVIRTYDHEVQGNTVVKPLCGKNNGPCDAAVLKPLDSSWRGLAISCGMNPNYGKIDPYWMAASVIDEAIRNNLAVGGQRIALLDNFVWGSPEKPDRLGALLRACQACYDFSKGFKIPFISGKDSLYNESPLGGIVPTLMVTGLGIVQDIRKTITMDLKNTDDYIYILGDTYPEMGGSEYHKLLGLIGSSVPKVRIAKANKTFEILRRTIKYGYVRACHDLSEGGLAVAAAEMAFSGGLGLDIWLDKVPAKKSMQRDDNILFSESNSRFLVEIPKDKRCEFERELGEVICLPIGRVKKDEELSVYGLKGNLIIEAKTQEMLDSWRSLFGGIDK